MSEDVIDEGEAEQIGPTKGLREAADCLYRILRHDKSANKLKALADALSNDTSRGTHKDMAAKINGFLSKEKYDFIN